MEDKTDEFIIEKAMNSLRSAYEEIPDYLITRKSLFFYPIIKIN